MAFQFFTLEFKERGATNKENENEKEEQKLLLIVFIVHKGNKSMNEWK